jgi:hypothetical protein
MKVTRTVIGVAFMALLLALYIAVAGYEAWLMIMDGKPLTLTYGIALMVAPVIGIWSLVRELQFGRDAARLMDRYRAEFGDVQIPVIDRRDRDAVDALLATPAPKTWQDALIRGLTLDSIGRRREARAAVRSALQLSR